MKNNFSINLSHDESTPLYQRLAQAVIEQIRQGRLVPGQKLPARLVIARTLGINPMTVRHAYEHLQQQGLLYSRHGSGTYVTADALNRLQQNRLRRYESITVVAGDTVLADCGRETCWIASDILAGVSESMSPFVTPFHFVKGFKKASLDHLTPDHAVLVMKCESSDSDPWMLDVLVDRGVPVLGMWGHVIDLPIPRVDYDHYQAASIAPQHLVDQGYRQIGFIGDKGIANSAGLGIKFLQFASVLHDAGLDYRACHVHNISAKVGEAYRVTMNMIEQGDMPEAIVVDTDSKALEVLSALEASGVKVPQDIAIIGRDGMPEGARLPLPLTTVRTPRRDIGRTIGKLLANWNESSQKMKSINLPAILVQGSTTAVGSEHPINQSL